MTRGQLPRRRCGPVLALVVDLFRDAWVNRTWAVVVVIVLSLFAVLAGTAGQAAAPFLVYGGL